MTKKRRPTHHPVDETFDGLVIALQEHVRGYVRRVDTGAEILLDVDAGPVLALGRRVRVRLVESIRDPGEEDDRFVGTILESRVDPSLWNRPPLSLQPRGTWDPKLDFALEEGDPAEQTLLDAGPRPEFEMEQVVPGRVEDDPDDDPILEAVDAIQAGEWDDAEDLLWRLAERDVRCIDAHVYLGDLFFDADDSEDAAREAIVVYEVGVAVGEQALPAGFDGVLPWDYVDNRPFLRALLAYGLCLWRLRRFDETLAVFRRLRRLDPNDEQFVRSLVGHVEEREDWSRPEDDFADEDAVDDTESPNAHADPEGDDLAFADTDEIDEDPDMPIAPSRPGSSPVPDLPSPYRALFAGSVLPGIDNPTAPLPPRAPLGRNDPCWCGSGRKYKHCHLDRNG